MVQTMQFCTLTLASLWVSERNKASIKLAYGFFSDISLSKDFSCPAKLHSHWCVIHMTLPSRVKHFFGNELIQHLKKTQHFVCIEAWILSAMINTPETIHLCCLLNWLLTFRSREIYHISWHNYTWSKGLYARSVIRMLVFVPRINTSQLCTLVLSSCLYPS